MCHANKSWHIELIALGDGWELSLYWEVKQALDSHMDYDA